MGKAVMIRENLESPGTHKDFGQEAVNKVVGTCMRIDRKAIGKTSKEMRDLLCTQRLSKEAMRGVGSVPLDPKTGAITVDDKKKEIDEDDINAPRLWLFPHPDAMQYEVSFSTFIQIGRKQEILSAENYANLHEDHASDAYLQAIGEECTDSAWSKMRGEETFPQKTLEKFLQGFSDWQQEQRRKRCLRPSVGGKASADGAAASSNPSPSKLIGRASASFVIETAEEQQKAKAEADLHKDFGKRFGQH